MSHVADTSPPTSYVEGLCHAAGLEQGMDRPWRKVPLGCAPAPQSFTVFTVMCPCREGRARGPQVNNLVVDLRRMEIGPPIITYWVGQCYFCKTIYWGSR